MPIDFEGLRDALAGRYALERELGHGATATVYLARDLAVHHQVAIKVLDPDLALPVTVERFSREIQISAALPHNYIMPMLHADAVTDPRSGATYRYYAMQYARDGTLADRLRRDGPFDPDDAVVIVREVAEALEYTHAQGVVHRDVKPGNILLSGRHAWLADFGIALRVGDVTLTATGGAPGTAPYESPEQSVGSKVDHRSDVYSLGVVLYELLTGSRPFSGPTREAIAAERLSALAPQVRKSRPTIPMWVNKVVAKALGPDINERYQTAKQFRDALAHSPRWIARLTQGAGVTAMVAGVAWGATEYINRIRLTPADTLTYAVLPVAYAESAGAERLTAALHDELAKWTGIRVVDQQRVKEEAAAPTRLTTREALKAARRLKAGRYITVDASRAIDSVRVHAVLHDGLTGGTPVRERTVRMAAGFAGADSVTTWLIDRLLFVDTTSAGWTRSFHARVAFEQGTAAVRTWDLASADSAFARGARHDPRYSQAHLWLAQVRFWNRVPVPAWQSSIQIAVAGRERLSARDRGLANALNAFASGDVAQACREWARLVRAAADFDTWFGLASCITRDDAVLRDSRTASGWRFRASYHRAIEAYKQAFLLQPSVHHSLRGTGFDPVRRLLKIGGSVERRGRAVPPDTTTFRSRPTWQGDSLVFVPYPFSVGPGIAPEGMSQALRKLRLVFHEISTSWVAAFPASADALEALAVSLEMLGDPSCVDTLRRARTLAASAGEKVRGAAAEVWTRIKFAVPLDISGIREARQLADSLLTAAGTSPPAEAKLLASLAALTGRARLAATLNQAAAHEWRAPSPIWRSAPAFLAFAAMGGPLDSLLLLEEVIARRIDNDVAPEERESARDEWLARPATLVFPNLRLVSVTQLPAGRDYLLDAQAALVRGNKVGVRRALEDVRRIRRAFLPQDLTLDALLPEAALWMDLGEDSLAADWLDPTLLHLESTAPLVFADPARAGALVRAMALRADLARRMGDRSTAGRWALAVTILWSAGDDVAQPVVKHMSELTR